MPNINTNPQISAATISAATALLTSIIANVVAIMLSNRTLQRTIRKDISQNTIQRIENLESDIQKYWRAPAHDDELGHCITSSFSYLAQDLSILQSYNKKKLSSLDSLYEDFFTTATGGAFQSPNKNIEHGRAHDASLAAKKLRSAIRETDKKS